jgi:hypothetical protein
MTAADWIGSAGVALLLVAYFFNLRGWLKIDSPTYALLNLLGAGLAGLASALLHYWPFIILEAVWVLVSLAALWKNLKQQNQQP